VLLPDCVAAMVHVPSMSSLALPPETVQTLVVFEAKATGSLELAVAASVKDELANSVVLMAGKLMVCATGVMVKLTGTGVAAA